MTMLKDNNDGNTTRDTNSALRFYGKEVDHDHV